jgi:RNA polymerase sigma-70 factor (ECF subfamily)
MLNSTDLTAFCERTLDEVYRYALRLTGGEPASSADLTQDTYAALLRHVERHPDDPVGMPWLITCCRHRYLDTIRARRRRERNQIRGWAPPAVGADERPDEVITALGHLRPDERVVLVLRHVDGLSIAEIAETTGKSVAATDSMLRRGRERLRSHVLREREEAERS